MIVVTGATGNVGKPLVRALATAGERVVAVSRRPAADLPEGVPHRQADLADPTDLKPVFDGAEVLFLLTSGDFAAAGGDVGDVLGAARAGGVRRVVLLSSLGVSSLHHPAVYEDAVIDSGLEWTVLRPGNFASNAMAWAQTVRDRREVAAPFGDVALPVIDPADIAEVAAAVLTDADHAGRTYELTGPISISPRQQAAAIADALGEPVRFTELARDEAKAAMVEFMPEPIVERTLDILGNPGPVLRRVSPDVERILGRSARPFADWVKRNVEMFR